MKTAAAKDPVNRIELPLLYSVDTVVIPGAAVPYAISTSMCRAAVEASKDTENTVFAALLRSVDREGEDGLDLYETGTIASIVHREKTADGGLKLLLLGLSRGRMKKQRYKGEYMTALVEKVEPVDPGAMPEKKAKEMAVAVSQLRRSFDALSSLDRKAGADKEARPRESLSPEELADAALALLPVAPLARQAAYETADPVERTIAVAALVDAELERRSIQRKIALRVKRRIDRNQREYYLREQLREIHSELGKDSEYPEIEEARNRLRDQQAPREVVAKAEREFARLGRIPSMSPEAAVLRTYCEWLAELPWKARADVNLDIEAARRILERNHHGMKRPKERVLEFIAVTQLVEKAKGPILCFVGPPGTGKTSLGRSVAEALGRDFVRMSLGGVRDEAEIRGHRKTYVGALPGKILQGMRRAGSSNPVFLLDEIDKLSNDYHGDPSSALLEVLDPEQNNAFLDHYLEVPYDLSHVFFVTTANSAHGIPFPLLDRMEIIEIAGYSEHEKTEIARTFLVPRAFERCGLADATVSIEDSALVEIIRRYTMESGVRNLEREIQRVARKVAQDAVASGCAADRTLLGSFSFSLTVDGVRELLGPPRFVEDADPGQASGRYGLAYGLAWTEYGGSVLPVEAATFPGSGELTLTGNLGDVMKESARAALSHVKSKAEELGLGKKALEGKDLHVHVPSGAIPKDGPSAGITIAASVFSALSGRTIPPGFAMTGEITLTGRVLQVGGLKEKLLAARRKGILDVIVPAGNAKDTEEIPAEVLSSLRLHPVESLEEVFELLFPARSSKRGAPASPAKRTTKKGRSPSVSSNKRAPR